MDKLYLLRHAQASYSSEVKTDYERPLTEQGQADARKMAKYIKENLEVPDIILCSSAKRAKMTLEPILEELDYKGKVVYDDDLYLPLSFELRTAVAGYDQDVIMVVSHNNGIQDYLSDLVRGYYSMDPCQLAVVDQVNGELLDYVHPKSL